jgi:hypothetical protein
MVTLWRSGARLLGAGCITVAAVSAASAAPLEDENLLVAVPDGFVSGYQAAQGSMTMQEFVPRGQTVETWSRMVTVQVFHNLHASPDAFADNLRKGWLGACPGSQVSKIKAGAVNGYAYALWRFTCPLNPSVGKPENMFAKFISGNDSFYSVQYAYRTPFTAKLAPPATAYLGGVSVCDSRLRDRPCPSVAP